LAVRLSWLENAYSPPFSAGDFDQ